MNFDKKQICFETRLPLESRERETERERGKIETGEIRSRSLSRSHLDVDWNKEEHPKVFPSNSFEIELTEQFE